MLTLNATTSNQSCSCTEHSYPGTAQPHVSVANNVLFAPLLVWANAHVFSGLASVGTGFTAVPIGVVNDVFVKWQSKMERVNGTINCTISLLCLLSLQMYVCLFSCMVQQSFY